VELGINFSSQTRTIDGWQVKEIPGAHLQ